MFERILIALDFSPVTRRIIDCTAGIPGVERIDLLHVVDATRPSRHGWTYDPVIENAKILIAEKKDDLGSRGLKAPAGVHTQVRVITGGSVPRAIVEAAEACAASLIVIGARGMNPVRELLLGSVSSAVLREATTSVLIIRPPAPEEPAPRPLFSTVLVPTDFSRPADEVIAAVRTLGGIARIILLHVVSHAESADQIADCVAEASGRLAVLAQDLAGAGIAATPRVRIGDPTETILAVADEDDASLIMMNAHGTGRLRTLILGSTTFTVTRRARQPVLVFRTGQAS